MATTLYYEDTLSALAISGFVVRSLSTTRGAALITKTVASSATAPVVVMDTGSTPLCFAYRVAAFSSTTGTYTHNHWGLESSLKANYSASTTGGTGGVLLYSNAGGLINQLTLGSLSGTEYATAAGVRSFTDTGLVRSVADGTWIVVFPAHDAFGVIPASGYTLSFGYNGPTAAANGDAYTTFPDTISPYVASGGTVPDPIIGGGYYGMAA